MTMPFRSLHALAVLSLAAWIPAQCPAGGYAPRFGGTTGTGAGAVGLGSPGSPGTPAPGSPGGPGTGEGVPDPAHSPRGPAGTNPTTPRNGGPAAGPPNGPAAAGGRTGARGAVMSFERGATSKDRLKFDWQHPVPPERAAGTSAAGAMPLAEALDVLWGGDQRPLLILRECTRCAGTDLPLLVQSANNERTLLFAKWFRVVRLPTHVTDPGHPFHNVFARFAAPAMTPHFYLLAHPGAEPVSFSGAPTQSGLWKGMAAVLRERYLVDPEKAVKEWLALLDQFDNVDARRKLAREELDAVRAEQGPKSERSKQLQERLDTFDKDKAALLAKETRITNLVLQPFPAAAAPK